MLESLNQRRLRSFPSEEECTQRLEIVFLHQLQLGIVTDDTTEGGWSTVERVDLVFLNHAPEGAGVRGTDGLSFVKDSGGTGKEGAEDDEGVADNPTDIGGAEEHIVGGDAEEVTARQVDTNEMAERSSDTLGSSSGTRGVENVVGSCSREGDTDFGGFLGSGDLDCAW